MSDDLAVRVLRRLAGCLLLGAIMLWLVVVVLVLAAQGVFVDEYGQGSAGLPARWVVAYALAAAVLTIPALGLRDPAVELSREEKTELAAGDQE